MTHPQRPCMGGFCSLRENCERYSQPYRYEPIERICKPGQQNQYVPVSFAGYPSQLVREAA